MKEHTKVPWESWPAKIPNGTEQSMDYGILDGDGELIAECFEKVGRTSEGRFIERPANANAAFIVRACNAHEQLVAALEKAVETIKVWHDIQSGQQRDYLWKLYLIFFRSKNLHFLKMQSCPKMKLRCLN